MGRLFPIFMKLEGRTCVVVGGGRIAEQKLASLLGTDAAIVVVSPEVSDAVRKLILQGEVSWVQRSFQPSDLDGAELVIAATDDRSANSEVFAAADRLGVLCNAVDEPEHCHFYYPAVVQRGDLQIAISTNGKSPALAQRIRRELEQRYDECYSRWLMWLGWVRSLYFQRRIGAPTRVEALHRIASREVYERYRLSRSRQREVPRG